MIQRLHSNLLLVADLDRTHAFYEQLGFAPARADNAVRVKLGDFTLAFMDENDLTIVDEAGLGPKGLGIYLYVEVDDVDEHYRLVQENGIVPRTEPKTWPWGKREFVVKDPDGYKLVFYAAVPR